MTLISNGHRLHDIANYSYIQFMAFNNMANRKEAVRRMAFVADLASVVGGMFAGKDNPIGEHLDSLDSIYYEDARHGK